MPDTTTTPKIEHHDSPQLAELRKRVRTLQREFPFIWSQAGSTLTSLLDLVTDGEARTDRLSAHVTTLVSMANTAAKHIIALQEATQSLPSPQSVIRDHERRLTRLEALARQALDVDGVVM